MSRDPFESSDSVRSGAPLPHARVLRLGEPLRLESGALLDGVEIAYEVYGALDAARSNAVLVCHAISGDSHVARHGPDDAPGWWDALVGPGRPIDTDRHFVICANALGGCRGSTGPSSLDPRTGRPYGRSFPEVTVGDLVACQARLCDALGIERLRAVVGGSLGGHLALAFAVRHPARVERAIPIASSARLSSQAIAFDVIGRNAIDRARDARTGLALARMLGHVTYLSRAAMARKFDSGTLERRASGDDFEHRFPVGAYLAYQGERFVERFDPETYRLLSLAMDRFSLGETPAEIAATLARAACAWLVVSFRSDWLFPPEQSREIVRALLERGAEVSYLDAASEAGHDAFLLAEDVARYGEHVRAFLAAAGPEGRGAPPFETHALATLVPRAARVIAAGAPPPLLGALRAREPARLLLAEETEASVLSGLRAGLSALHVALDDLPRLLPPGCGDAAVVPDALSRSVELDEWVMAMLRVAPRLLVSFENAAHDAHRQRLAKQGRVPAGWHQGAPARRFSIEDLRAWARARGVRIERLLALDTAASREIRDEPDRLADRVLAVLAQ